MTMIKPTIEIITDNFKTGRYQIIKGSLIKITIKNIKDSIIIED